MQKLNALSFRLLSLFGAEPQGCHPQAGFCCVVCGPGRKRSCAGHCFISGACPDGHC